MTEVTSQLFQSAARCECGVLAYCVMPDHLHTLIEAQAARADFDALMTCFTRGQRSLWQPGHRERVLRGDEASDSAARYILENPVRAGLTRVVGEYPFAWSDVYDLESLLSRTNTRQRGCATAFIAPALWCATRDR